jgi:hypothetical protein
VRALFKPHCKSFHGALSRMCEYAATHAADAQ